MFHKLAAQVDGMKTQADYLSHIRNMAKLDKAYAQYIYPRYVAKLDWLVWPAWEALNA